MSVFNFIDYRTFIRKYITNLPKNGRGEINRMALFAGIHPSLLSQILANEKNLNLEQAQLVAVHMDLTVQETDFFLHLVQYQRAGTTKLQNYFKDKLNSLKSASVELSQRIRQDRQLSEEEKSIMYSHWLYLAVWLYTSVDNGKTLEEICGRFEISRERGTEITNFLISTNLCSLEKGAFVMGAQSVHLGRLSPHLHKHHTNWRLRAIDASDKISADELMYTAPMSVSKADFNKIRERLAEVIKEVTDTAIHSKAEDMVYFGIDFFWVKK